MPAHLVVFRYKSKTVVIAGMRLSARWQAPRHERVLGRFHHFQPSTRPGHHLTHLNVACGVCSIEERYRVLLAWCDDGNRTSRYTDKYASGMMVPAMTADYARLDSPGYTSVI